MIDMWRLRIVPEIYYMSVIIYNETDVIDNQCKVKFPVGYRKLINLS